MAVLSTNQRLACHTSTGGWLSFWLASVHEFYPNPREWELTLVWADAAPLRLTGLAAPALCVDVARALGVSHGAVYRHFPSKQALREAVTRRWLDQFHAILEPIDDPREWLHALLNAKRSVALEDPELFATYAALVTEQSAVEQEHVAWLSGQLEAMVEASRVEGHGVNARLREPKGELLEIVVQPANVGKDHHAGGCRILRPRRVGRELRAVGAAKGQVARIECRASNRRQGRTGIGVEAHQPISLSTATYEPTASRTTTPA